MVSFSKPIMRVKGVDLHEFFKMRLDEVQSRIKAACRRARRKPEDITLVAVTKSVDSMVAAQLHSCGVPNLGESRPQELWHKAEQLPATVNWHLIGHLQRNKVERTLPLVSMIHSVDSLRLLEAIDQAAERPVSVLLEVNTSGEVQKHGFQKEELTQVIERIASFKYVEIQGLMTMAALDSDPQRARPAFSTLRELSNELKKQVSLPHEMRHLSMGMSNDFEVAIEEGATLIRIGSILFEGLPGEAA